MHRDHSRAPLRARGQATGTAENGPELETERCGMCGIIGYTGKAGRDAGPILLQGLSHLEDGDYDSSDIAIALDGGRGIVTRKRTGRIDALREFCDRLPVHGPSGIAQTRKANGHAHSACNERIALVYSGDTEPEIFARSIEEAEGETLEVRVITALRREVGAYRLAVISADEPGKIVVARHRAPLLLGIGKDESFVASDPCAILEHTASVVNLVDGDIAVLTPDSYRIIDRDARPQRGAVDEIARIH